jgi:hypothetical protein
LFNSIEKKKYSFAKLSTNQVEQKLVKIQFLMMKLEREKKTIVKKTRPTQQANLEPRSPGV